MPEMAINDSKAHRVEKGALTKLGTGINAPARTIWGSIKIITINGAELEFGASAEAKTP